MHGEYEARGPSSLSPLLAHVLNDTKRSIAHEGGLTGGAAISDLAGYVTQAATRLGIELSSFERDEILAHLEGDFHLWHSEATH
jgi:hypothetical protein